MLLQPNHRQTIPIVVKHVVHLKLVIIQKRGPTTTIKSIKHVAKTKKKLAN
jgi:hypothetical protein